MSATVFFADNGEYATITATFRDKSTGDPADPGTVQCIVTDPIGTATTYTYAGADIIRVSEGVYAFTVASPLAGIWMYKWAGTAPAADVFAGTWTVTTAELNRFYCSIEELKSRLGIDDTADDFEATIAVQGACQSINDITGRYFWRGTDTRTYVPWSIYEAHIDDLVSLTALKTDDDGDGVFETTWTTGQYQLQVAPGKFNTSAKGEAWPYTSIRALGNARYFPVINPMTRVDLVQVSGVFGWPAVPLAIKQAALIAAADLFKIKDAPFGIAGYGQFGAVRVRQNPRVMALISRYVDPEKVGV